MTARRVRNRIATGCLAAMLFPAGVAFAQNPTAPKPRPEASITCGDLLSGFPVPFKAPFNAAPLAPAPANATAPWFRTTLAPIRPDVKCPVVPTDVAATTEAPAEAQPAVDEVLPPGTVQNLRRVERH